jgi:hypothetical protein
MDEKPLHVAVLHGHLSLAYTILARWERETGRTLDLILQVGDLGAYPLPLRLDKATRRFAQHDPDELGFSRYHAGDAEAEACLGKLRASTVFIRGNHEDFRYLHESADGSEAPVTLDPFGRIAYLPSGACFTFERRQISLRIAGLGGISHHGKHGTTAVTEHYTASDVRAVRKLKDIDVLLTHEPAYDSARLVYPLYREHGSYDVAALLDALRPRFHFCGHWHEPGASLLAPDGTESRLLHAVNFTEPARINVRCGGVLSWSSREKHAWEWLEAPWLYEYTRHDWRAVDGDA